MPNIRAGAVVRKLKEERCRVAEIGCGAGGALVALKKHFPNIELHGFEMSQHALQRSKVK